jgi:SAM-dependent methyltransferase
LEVDYLLVHEKKPTNWDKLWRNDEVDYSPHYVLVEKIKELRVRKVVEFGAGSGSDIAELARDGMEAIFADASRIACKRYKWRKPLNEVVTCDVRQAPFKEESFELSYCVGLLEHFDRNERRKIIREMTRVSEKYLLIDVPQKWSPLSPVKEALMFLDRWKFGWETSLSFWQIVGETKDEGLDVVSRYGRVAFPIPRRFTQKIGNMFLTGFLFRFWLRFQECMWWGLFNSCGVLFQKSKDTRMRNIASHTSTKSDTGIMLEA